MTGLITFSILIAYASSFVIEKSLTDSKSECEINPSVNDYSPLVVISGKSDFLYPKSGEKTLTFSNGQSVEFACPGRNIIVGSTTGNDIVSATCVSGSKFKISGKEVQWTKITCTNYPYRTARYTGKGCESNGKEIEIGFDIGDRFLRSTLLCFNTTSQESLYSHANMTSAINERVSNTPRPSWMQGSGIFDITTVNNYYLTKNQRKTINSLLGLSEDSTKYIQNNNNFLSRGHMTARSDHFYPAQQNATFFLLNVAPQWQSFNGDNWNQVEMDVRDYAESRKVDLKVWTGVYGITALPHEKTGKKTELFLYINGSKKALPVPELYWKVAYEPISQKGVALIGVNNPYLSSYQPLCEDVSDKLSWLNWKKDDQAKGFSYACTVDTLRKAVSYLPKFTVKGLLT